MPRKKKVTKDFWVQSGNKWFGRIGPLSLAVCEPVEDNDKEFLSFVEFRSTRQVRVGNDMEAAKASAIEIAQQLFDEAKEIFDNLPDEPKTD